MGRTSQRYRTGLTYEERVANPRNLNNKVDVLRLQKQRNRENKAIRQGMELLFKSSRIGKVSTSEKSK